jgi:diguanylate cyclase (GGDEF)-like protein
MAKILLVDDRASNREVIAALLRPQGHTVLEASHGKEALARVRMETPDLVITDILMPLMDGYEFVRQLRSDETLKEIPVIFYSANYLEAEALDLAQAYGVSQVIRQPFEPEDVLKMVGEALQPNAIVDSLPPPSGDETLVGLHLRVMTNKLCQQVSQLEELKGQSEQMVVERTAQLESANRELRDQIAERRNAEKALLEAHKELELRAREMEQHASEMKLLAEMGELLQSCVSSEEARQVSEQYLQKFFPANAAIIYLTRGFGGWVEPFAKWNSVNLTSKETFEPQECWGLRRGRPHVIRDVNAATKCAHLQDAKEGGSICIPMIGQGQSLGVLHVAWNGGDSAQDVSRVESRERLAVKVADTMALAITNVRLREMLKEQTIRDPLTQLYNRRYLEDTLNREISRATRAGARIGIIMLDIDNFKQFNDSFGHLVGDELLRALGTFLKTHLRPEDIPSRYGGEEFILVLPGASCEIVRDRAETLRKGFRGIQLDRGQGIDKTQGAISLSFGVAVFPEHGATVEGVLRAADEALYQAKMGGKDCVVVAADKTPATTKRQQPQAV